jgi:Glycoside hydrolase 123, catalytic domain/Glycoside hydrolase 123 N-terminal domain
MRWVCLSALLLLALPCHAADRNIVSAWLVDSLVKVFPDTRASSSSEMKVASARNGHTSLQLALRSDSKQNVKVRVIAPRNGNAALSAKSFHVGFVRVDSHPTDTPIDEVVRPEVGPYPDPLFPLPAEISLQSQRTEAVWISVFTPADTKPGTFRGLIEIEAGKQRTGLPFQVEVFAATVPKEQKLRVTNWLWFEQERMEKHFPRIKRDPERYWRVLENIGRTMSDYKQNVAFIPVRTLAKPHLVDGVVRYDFILFDRWVDTFDKAGMSRLIEGGHICSREGGGYDAPIILSTDFIENGALVQKNLPADDPRAEQNLREFLRELRTHLKEKGWLNRYLQHIHDEPHGPEMPTYKRLVRIVREEMPEVPTIDAISLEEDLPSQQETTIWVPLLSTFDNKLSAIADHKTQGGQGWYYICMHPRGRYLNRFVDFPLVKVRLLHWINYRYSLSGYLHWGGNFWMDRPYDELQPNWGGDTFLPAGDNTIVYPDPENDSVFVSTRLEIQRQSEEDYELLLDIAQHSRQRADALAAKVIPDFTSYARDVNQFRQFERELLTLASQSQSSSGR